MKEKLANDLKNAMKNKNKDLLSVVRMVKGSIQLEEINLKRELTEEEVTAVISKNIKSRKETVAELEKTERPELLSQTLKEIEILNRYMPEQLPLEKVKEIIESVFEEVKPSINDTGTIMSKLSPLLKGKTDMSVVNKIVKEKLNSL